ncbi:MAG: Rrf2 family transcriptional regulator [Phaeodactylibacter sp.]|nr:Rrf2 family transcriptional regulator [Phaeodactylibacter sp.]MCB9300048.1 Rrf2 family transcriptional regulator [Lewinellaceae bacterium]
MFSKSCKYAIRAVLYLAANASEAQKAGVKEIADALDVPKHFLAKILQDLSRHNLISSAKGPSGGFFLSEKNRRATLRSVVESIDGPDIFTSCILGLPVCSSENPCPLHSQAMKYRNGLLDLIEHQPIEEVARKVREKGLQL